MRFLSSHRSSDLKTPQLRLRGRYGVKRRSLLGWTRDFCSEVRFLPLVLMLVLLGLVSQARVGFAQPPGTTPTREVFEQQQEDGVDSQSLPIRAFMFLSESDNVVLMPGLTWEEFERLSNPDSDVDAQQQSYSYQSLAIKGDADQERFEGEVVVRVLISPTQGQWIRIPLRMGNFHRLAPPDVTGVDEYFMTLTPDGSGHLLLVKTDKQQEVTLRMQVSARVAAGSVAKTLDFQLPDVPSKVDLGVDGNSLEGNVLGRGDEVLKATVTPGNATKFSIESGGGNYALRWGSSSRSKDDVPLLEAESRINVRWDSPSDPIIADVLLTVENVRGSIDSFQLRLPRGSIVLGSPRLGNGGQTIELGDPIQDRDSEIRDVIIPEEERQLRIDLNFQLQLDNTEASEADPLKFHVAEVVGSLRHNGVIVVSTGSDYRLRWLSSPWVDRVVSESVEESTTSGRTYEFQFERASFELPLWLGEKGRQLRITSTSQLTVYDSTANLDMIISINGQVSEGLKFNDAGWQITDIQNPETGERLDPFEENDRFMDMKNVGNGDASQIRILAELSLAPKNGDVEFFLPMVTDADDVARVQKATLDIISKGRLVLVVDLESSEGLTRRVVTGGDASAKSSTTSFQLQTQEQKPKVAGALVAQPPRISLASEATIELSGDQLRTSVNWTVTSSLDLEGGLPIRIPNTSSPVVPAENGIGDGLAESSQIGGEREAVEDGQLSEAGQIPEDAVASAEQKREARQDEPWIVIVNGAPARLRFLDGDRYQLISERLSMDTIEIEWRRVQDLTTTIGDGVTVSVPLPSPGGDADVTVRGTMGVTLRGDARLGLVSADRQMQKRIDLVTFPRDPIRLKLVSRLTSPQELTVRQTVLRTVVGRNLRQESVHAKVQGGGSFRVDLPSDAIDVSVQAFINGERHTVVREDNTLIVLLPSDSQNHEVDLQVWTARETPSSFATIEPLLRLPFGVGRVYWQIIAPLDGHVLWASPTLGRSMSWRFDRWKLYRQPSHDDRQLLQLVGTTSVPSPPGNRYLYIGSDLRSFEVVIVSRVVLWILIGSVVLFAAVVLTNFPKARHPLTAVVLAVVFGGLLAIAPDAAVLAGQFGIIALVLVVVMIAVRVLFSPGKNGRVFSTTTTSTDQARPPSTRSLKPVGAEHTGVAATAALPPPPPTEVTT